MSAVIKDAALIIGVAAIVVATAGTGALGAGAALAAGNAAAAVGAAVGATVSVSALAAGLGIAAAAATFAAGALAKKPSAVGNPMTWQSDPQAGIPIVAGRSYYGGKIVYRQTFGGDNVNQTINTVFSIGPIKGFEQLYIDGVATSVTGNQANITDFGKMFIATQLGAQPEAHQIAGTNNPDITTASKMSGLAADTTTLSYDTTGGHTMTTEPQKGWVLGGVRVYDPRKDSTYPGGSGTQRWNDETTWSYTGFDNPYLFGLSWLIGWHMNGKLVAGAGIATSAIILGQFVEGANIADANGWTMGGVLDSTDSKWGRLKDVLLAGGGEPIRLGAQIGCMINTPRVSLATIGVGDVIGDASVQATQAMRNRINAVVPRYMAEQSVTVADTSQKPNSSGVYPLKTTVTWGLASAGPIVVSDYVTFDGGQRQKQIDFQFVQGVANGYNAPNQVAQLARYAIENAREFGPITLPLKLRWMGYKPGDVVTANLPELGLISQDILLLNRSLDASKGSVTMTARSETAAKHAFALGQTTTAPPTPTVSGVALITTPGDGAWAITDTSVSQNGQVVPALVVTGAADSSAIDGILFEDRIYTGTQGDDDDWHADGLESPGITTKRITGLIGGVQYQVSVRYRRGSGVGPRFILGPSTPNIPVGLGGPGAWTILNRENMTIIGSTVYKSGGTAYGDASVTSAESYIGGASCGFQPAQTNAALEIGLNSDPGTDDNYTSIDYGWNLDASGNAHPIEAGTNVGGTYAYVAGNVFQVSYDGASIYYIQNGTVRYTHAVSAGLQLWLDSAFGTIGGKVTNLTFTGTGKKGDQGVPGTAGAPGTNGTNGATLYTWVAYADDINGAINFTTGAPSGRAFQGVAINQTTATESTNPALYQWGLYKGPALFGLVATGNCIDGPDYIIKNGGTAAWDSSAYSDTSFTGGCNVAFNAAATNLGFMIGINSDPTTDSNFSSLDYAWYCAADGTRQIYESGSFIASYGSYGTSNKFQIRYDGKTVTYIIDATVIRQVAVASGLTFFLDSSFLSPGARANSVSWSAAGAAGANGVAASLTQAAIQVAAYSDGTLKAGSLTNAVGVFKVLDGGVDKASASTFSVLSQTNCSVTVDGSGNYAVSSVNADSAVATFRAAYNGVNYDRTLSITLSKDGTAAYALSNTASGSFSNTGTYAQIMAVTIDTSSGQGLNCTAIGRYNTTSGTFIMQQKLQYSLNAGSTWTDITGSEQTGPLTNGETETVSSSGSVTTATIGAATSVQVRTLWRRSGGTASAVNISGRETVSWANV